MLRCAPSTTYTLYTHMKRRRCESVSQLLSHYSHHTYLVFQWGITSDELEFLHGHGLIYSNDIIVPKYSTTRMLLLHGYILQKLRSPHEVDVPVISKALVEVMGVQEKSIFLEGVFPNLKFYESQVDDAIDLVLEKNPYAFLRVDEETRLPPFLSDDPMYSLPVYSRKLDPPLDDLACSSIPKLVLVNQDYSPDWKKLVRALRKNPSSSVEFYNSLRSTGNVYPGYSFEHILVSGACIPLEQKRDKEVALSLENNFHRPIRAHKHATCITYRNPEVSQSKLLHSISDSYYSHLLETPLQSEGLVPEKRTRWIQLVSLFKMSELVYDSYKIKDHESVIVKSTTIEDLTRRMICESHPSFPVDVLGLIVEYFTETKLSKKQIQDLKIDPVYSYHYHRSRRFSADEIYILEHGTRLYSIFITQEHLLSLCCNTRGKLECCDGLLSLIKRVWCNATGYPNIFTSQSHLPISKDLPCNEEPNQAQYVDLPLLKSQFALYPYQIKNVSWMRSIENRINSSLHGRIEVPMGFTEFEYRYSGVGGFTDDPSCCESTPGQMPVLFDCTSANLYTRPDMNTINNLTKDRIFSFKGGIFADDVGLGKTLSLVALSFSNPDTCLPVVEHGKLRYRGIHVISGRISTGSTLIACPNTLAYQIRDEILKFFHLHPHQVLLVSTKPQHSKLTALDYVNAEFVITTYNFLGGPYYTKNVCNGYSSVELEHQDSFLSDPTLTRVPFDCFHWHRLILDEAHELFNIADTECPLEHRYLTNAADRLIHYTSKYKWACSATPFSNLRNQLPLYAQFLDLRLNGVGVWEYLQGQSPYTAMSSTEFDKFLGILSPMIEFHVIRRNTKESIGEQNHIPPYKEEVVLLDMTSQERLLHDALPDIASKLTVCSCPELLVAESISGQTHLDDIVDIVNTSLTRDLLHTTELIHLYESHSQSESALSVNYLRNWTPERIQRTRYRQTILRHGSALYSNVPARRDPLLLEERNDNIELGSIEWEDLVTRRGSKLPHVLRYVQNVLEDPSARVIIFSVHEALILDLPIILTRFNMSSVVCKGNVHIRANAFAAFKDPAVPEKDTPRVLLMSLRNNASGADLFCSTHIILLDSMFGSREHLKAQELQAIGRGCRQNQALPVSVVRFLFRDSKELELYNSLK